MNFETAMQDGMHDSGKQSGVKVSRLAYGRFLLETHE